MPSLSRTWVALLVLLGGTLYAGSSHAQETHPFVSNLSQGSTSTASPSLWNRAQGFDTGSHQDGYTLRNVQIVMGDTQYFKVSVCPTDSNGQPPTDRHGATGSGCTELALPSPKQSGAVTFNAPSGTTLLPDTTYSVIIEFGSNYSLARTSSDNEDENPTEGWSIANGYLFQQLNSGYIASDPSTPDRFIWRTSRYSFRMTVNGVTATGKPNIEGRTFVPALLTVDTSEIGSLSGLTDPDFTYQWIRVDANGTNPVNVGTDSTYTLTDSDAGKQIKVKVGFVDDLGRTDSVTSDAFPSVDDTVGEAAVCNAPRLTGGAAIIWSGNMRLGEHTDSALGDLAGYSSVGTGFGTLDDPTFRFDPDGAEYTITDIHHNSGSGHTINLGLDQAFSADEKRTLTLYGCSEPLYLMDTANPQTVDGRVIYKWENTGLIWSSYIVKTLYLVRDEKAPEFSSVAIDTTAIALTFTEDLASNPPPVTAFTVNRRTSAGVRNTVGLTGAATIEGAVLTLTLSSAVTDTDILSVVYAKPESGNKLSDFFLNEVAEFTTPAFSIGVMGLGCLAPDLGDREKVWEGDLSVGVYRVGQRKEIITGYGYDSVQGFGSLDPDNFTIGGNDNYGIKLVLLYDQPNPGVSVYQPGDFVFVLDRALKPEARADLQLHVCDAAPFEFAAADSLVYTNNAGQKEYDYSWSNVDLEWANIFDRKLTLSRAKEEQSSQQQSPETIAETATAGPEARFASLPDRHDGASEISFELHFSEEPDELSYLTVRNGLLEVSGGTVTGARRMIPHNDTSWLVTVEPSSGGDIFISIPARPCGATNSVCFDGRPLATSVATFVPGVEFFAVFSKVPKEHDGVNSIVIEMQITDQPDGLSYLTVQDGLFEVSGGSIERAWRLNPPDNKGWGLRIVPDGTGDVVVRLRETTDCGSPPGVCTEDGRMLPGNLQATVYGPAVLSVSDAEVREGPAANLEFTVSLSRQRYKATEVTYTTSDSTARTADGDYTAVSGTLVLPALQTGGTISVPVLDDDLNEGTEYLFLTLSAASGAVFGDSIAIGTIINSDPLPDAWLARFGRSVSDQVMRSVERRLESGSRSSHLTISGREISRLWDRSEAYRLQTGLVTLLGLTGAYEGSAGNNSGGVIGIAGQKRSAPHSGGARIPDPRALVSSTSFHFNRDTGSGTGGGSRRISAWGEYAFTRFNGNEDGLSLEGDVNTAIVALDGQWGRRTAGVAFSYSEGRGGYTRPDAGSDASGGTIGSTLAAFYPYVHYRHNRRTSVWGMLGYGRGNLEVTPDETESILETEVSNAMAALGARGLLTMHSAGAGLVELAVRSDVLLTRTTSASIAGLSAGKGATSRMRLILESSGALPLLGGILTPNLETGLRYDGGDAETGAGIEAGGGLGWIDGPLLMRVNAHRLLVHNDGAYEEWGYGASMRYEAGTAADGRGLRLRLGSRRGASPGGVQRLWSARTAVEMMPRGSPSRDLGYDAEVGYGIRSGGLWYPYLAADTDADGHHVTHLGLTVVVGSVFDARLEISRSGGVSHLPDATVIMRGSLRF